MTDSNGHFPRNVITRRRGDQHSRMESEAAHVRMLEGLANAEVETPPSLLCVANHDQVGNRIELIPDIEANRPKGRCIAKTRPDGIS